MKRYIVLGVDQNPKYLYYLPLVVWAWRYFGWDVFILWVAGTGNDFTRLIGRTNGGCTDLFHRVTPQYSFKTSTIAQVSRLCAANVVDGLLMTSDADMLPLSDYWAKDLSSTDHGIITYGRDLTDYHYPICYITMHSNKWKYVMNGGAYENIKDPWFKKQDSWTLDQDIITERLLKYGKEKITHINRGTDKRTGYPIGRVDRSHWTLDHPKFIDAHLPHDILTNEKSFHNVMQLLHTVWPRTDFKWFLQYTKEFKKLL